MPFLRANPGYGPLLLIDFIVVFSISFVVWLLACFLFDDHFQFQAKHIAILVALVTISLLVQYRVPGFFFSWGLQYPVFAMLLGLFPQLFHLPFFLFALAVALSRIRDDLVEKRRALRAELMAILTGYAGFVVIFQIYRKGKSEPAMLESVHLSMIIILSYFLLYKLVFQRHVITGAKTRGAASIEPVDKDLEAKLHRQMSEQKAYRTPGLTIRKLALLLAEPEYKLRRHINQNLGYKNFNDFLNSHRIEEAREILEDREAEHRTILDIALELGYQSLSTFNKAFKQQTNQTPSAYRKRLKT